MKTIKRFALPILAILMLFGCKPKQDNVMTIGIVLPLTGSMNQLGQQEKEGMQLAEKVINEASQHPRIKLVFEDSKSNSKDGLFATTKLANQKVDLLMTCLTGVTEASIPIAERNKIDLAAFCADHNIASSSPFASRVYEGMEDEGAAIVKYINEYIDKEKRVGIIYNQVNCWEYVVSDMLVPAINSKNQILCLKECYPVGEKDFSNLIGKIRKAKLDFLIVLSYGYEFPSLYPMLVENHVLDDVQVVGGWGYLYPTVDPSLLENTIVAAPKFLFEQNEEAQTLANLFSSEYSKQLNYDIAMAYNAIFLVDKYLSLRKGERRFKELLIGEQVTSSVVGDFCFDSNGSLRMTNYLGRYQGGQLVPLD